MRINLKKEAYEYTNNYNAPPVIYYTNVKNKDNVFGAYLKAKFKNNQNNNVGDITAMMNALQPNVLHIGSLRANRGYGRKVFKSLIDYLKLLGAINNNTTVELYASPIDARNRGKVRSKENLNRFYTKLGFVLNNKNGYFRQKVSKLNFGD